MEFPEDRLYSEYHLWIMTDDGRAPVGITDFAVEELGSVDYVELPRVGDEFVKGQPFGTVETSKAITDLIAPIGGTVVECNDSLTEAPHMVTEDPYGKGWLVIVRPSDSKEVGRLMTADAYERLVVAQTVE